MCIKRKTVDKKQNSEAEKVAKRANEAPLVDQHSSNKVQSNRATDQQPPPNKSQVASVRSDNRPVKQVKPKLPQVKSPVKSPQQQGLPLRSSKSKGRPKSAKGKTESSKKKKDEEEVFENEELGDEPGVRKRSLEEDDTVKGLGWTVPEYDADHSEKEKTCRKSQSERTARSGLTLEPTQKTCSG